MGSVYNIPYSCSFVDTLAQKFSKEYEKNKEDLADVVFLLPNRRTCVSLKEAFVRYNGQKPTMLPKIIPIGDIEEDDIFLLNADNQELISSILPAIDDFERLFIFARLIVSKPADYGLPDMTYAQALSLAKDLSKLIDVSYQENLSFSALENIVPEQFSEHWQQTLKFLKIITGNWPKILQSQNMIDSADRKNLLIKAKTDLWKRNNTKQKIVVAGVSVGYEVILDLIKTVSELENGEVYLYGLDKNLSQEDWELIEPSHPQYELKKLLSYLNRNRFEIKDYVKSKNPQREKFISEVMLPALATTQWRNLKAGSYGADALTGLSFIDCADDRQEALTIALILREALNTPEKTAALVTTDRNLARRVASELERWDIKIDDSAGKPLHLTPIGIFLRLILKVIEEDCSASSLLNLAKNPFVKLSREPLSLIRDVREWEYQTRKPVFSENEKEVSADVCTWIAELKEVLRPLYELYQQKDVSFHLLLKTHLEVAQNLCADNVTGGEVLLWKSDEGKSAADLFSSLLQQADVIKGLDPSQYLSVLTVLMSSKSVRYNYGTHPRLKILGPIEARFNRFDTIVIGAVNEGFWPELPSSDPWLSRPMKSSLEISLPEKNIGVLCADFCQFMCADNVYITRAERSNSAPTSKSRWLLRAETVLKACKFEIELLKNYRYAKLAKLLNEPEKTEKILPPAPVPPVKSRPRTLSASAIETLVRDPYEIYAKRILKLRPLDDLEERLDASDYGNIVHKVLERFNKKYEKELPDNALEEFKKIGLEEFSKIEIAPEVRAFWWPLFENTAEWIIKTECQYKDEIKKTYSEVKGQIEYEAPAGKFTITARADRIDITKDGKVNIVDYKTGSARSKKEIFAGYAPQLPVEGLIASKGGFYEEKDGKKTPVPAAEVNELIYWKLGKEEIRYSAVDGKTGVDIIEQTSEQLHKLVSLFDFETTPYMARPNPNHLPFYSDYEHLARAKEWSVEGQDD